MLADLADLKIRLAIEHNRRDEELKQVLAGVSAAVESWLQRTLLKRDYVERYNGNRKKAIVLNQYPVLEVKSVKVNGREIHGFDNDDWLLIYDDSFSDGLRNVEVAYVAGYETIPEDIREAVLIIAAQRVNEMENKGVASKSLAGETVSFSNFSQSGGMPPAAFEILKKYRRKV
ncbi:phage head-tail connector protein [Bergeriella denitrificans]|uniref:Putative phage associated protein n=1 Tax=Bergeriella denitrificans TaxID=494 RepID=A0A378UL21_BERDE|nr:phage head-tail connector protein [Bergeriella denitrificans]STZ77349.1 putative phage associated protein [Bergeriella denitrificans]